MQSADDNWMGGGGAAQRPVMRLCVRAVISSRCKCFLVQVGPANLFIQEYLHQSVAHHTAADAAGERGGMWSHQLHQLLELWLTAGQTLGRRDVFSWIASICLGCPVFSILNTRKVWQAGEVSGSDITTTYVSSACLPAFILVGLFPVCISHVCSSGAWNVDRAPTLPCWCGDAQKSCILSCYLKCIWTILANWIIFTPKMFSPLKASLCACVLITWARRIKRQAL